MIYRSLFIIAFFSIYLGVAGCSTVDENDPLKGERISVLQYQDELEPDSYLASSQMNLPDSWSNSFWPQSGGYPSHAMGVLRLDMPLKKQWSVSIGKGNNRRSPLSIQPVIADDTIFTIDSRALLTASNTLTGKKKWSISLAPENEEETGVFGGGIAFSEGYLFVTSGYKQVLCIEPTTGKIVWQTSTTSPTRSSPAVLAGRVFIITLDNHLLSYSTKDGSLLWSYAGVPDTTNLLGASSPAVDRDIVVAAFSSGEVVALRTENGHVLWQDNLSSLHRFGSLPGISDIRGLPVIDRGIVYVVGSAGRMVALDERSGNRIWQKEIGGTETPWTAGDTVFTLTSTNQLIALTRQSGEIHWVSKLPSFADKKHKDPLVWTGPVLGGDVLIITSNKGHVLQIDPYTGKVSDKWKLSQGTTISPVIADNKLYILEKNAKLVSYGIKQ